MTSEIVCSNSSCNNNKNSLCTLYRPDCGRDVLFCKMCSHEEFVVDPLQQDRCPGCRSRIWDKGYRGTTGTAHPNRLIVYNNGKWVPKSDILS